MKTRFLLAVCLLTLAARLAPAQLNFRAVQLRNEALALHVEGKPADALERVQAALKLSPKDENLKAYAAELNRRVELDQLDQHARQAPADVETSVARLAEYLVKPARSAEDRARLIFTWVADRIAYDVEGRRAGQRGDQTPAGVLQNRKAVCDGYSNLFLELARAAGLEVIKITGQAKGATFRATGKPENHAWNAVRLNGEWRLIDATWGAGNTSAMGFKKRFKEHYFLADPHMLRFTHLPKDPQWQLINPPITQEQFLSMPKASALLFVYGISPAAVQEQINKGLESVVEPLELPREGPRIVIRSAPLESKLKAGQKYRFEVLAPGFNLMAVSNGPKTVRMMGRDGVFTIEVAPQKGTLIVAGRFLGDTATTFPGILRYQVE